MVAQMHLLELLAHAIVAVFARHVQTFVIEFDEAAADAEFDAAIRHKIDHGELLGDLNWAVQRQHDDRGAEPGALRALRERREKGRRRRNDAAVSVEVMLVRPKRIETQRLTLAEQIERSPVAGRGDAGTQPRASARSRVPADVKAWA